MFFYSHHVYSYIIIMYWSLIVKVGIAIFIFLNWVKGHLRGVSSYITELSDLLTNTGAYCLFLCTQNYGVIVYTEWIHCTKQCTLLQRTPMGLKFLFMIFYFLHLTFLVPFLVQIVIPLKCLPLPPPLRCLNPPMRMRPTFWHCGPVTGGYYRGVYKVDLSPLPRGGGDIRS